jgi:hypothetical protein
MKIIEKIKQFFKKSSQDKKISPIISHTIQNEEDATENELKAIEKRREQKEADEKMLTEYLASEYKRKKEAETTQFENIKLEKNCKKQRSQKLQKEEQIRNEPSSIINTNQKRLDENIEKQRKIEQLKLQEQIAEQERLEKIKAEEQRKKEENEFHIRKVEQERLEEIKNQERKVIEIDRIRQIWELSQTDETIKESWVEASKFLKEFGKDVKCCVCSQWGHEVDLYAHRGQTYCEKHIPPAFQRENERKIKAGRHGAANDHIKK